MAARRCSARDARGLGAARSRAGAEHPWLVRARACFVRLAAHGPRAERRRLPSGVNFLTRGPPRWGAGKNRVKSEIPKKVRESSVGRSRIRLLSLSFKETLKMRYRLSSFAPALAALTLALAASADSYDVVGKPDLGFTATGPGGLKINGT